MTTNVNPNSRVALTLFSAAALFGSLSLSSCQDYDPLGENGLEIIVANKNLQARYDEYTANFNNTYGKPAPNHNWGFRDLPVMNLGASNTRAGSTETVDVNRNMWIETDNNGYKSTALALNIDIPGWPNFDDHYYAASGDFLADICCDVPASDKQYIPAGDVTEYEIQYVSRWFRTYKEGDPEFDGAKVKLHLSDFFVQNVSADYDQITYPEGEDITSSKVAYDNATSFDHDFNVWTKDGADESLPYTLDYLHFMPIGANVNNKDSWTHINNFNHGNTNYDPEDHAGNNPDRMIMYVYSSGTENFACRPAFGTGQQEEDMGDFIDSWVLVKLEWDEKGKCCEKGECDQPANGHHRVGYYLAFDYQAKKYDENDVLLADISCDGYYSNWIIKISPATFAEEAPAATRVMCEDLGNTYDFDFNDVVFDVAFHQVGSQTDAVINLQAAGGTMPIYVGFDKDKFAGAYEAHKMLENGSSTPVNVGGASHDMATYRIENVGTTNAGDIKIWVENNGTMLEISGVRGNLDKYNNGENGNENAPQRFAVPTSVQWMDECKFIQDGYPVFKAWVNYPSMNPLWYNAIGNNKLIHNYVALSSHHNYVEGEEITGEGGAQPITFNWDDSGNNGTFTIPASYFASANTKITITFTDDDIDFNYALPNDMDNVQGVNADNKVLTITESTAISRLKEGSFNVFSIYYCSNPSAVTSEMFTIVCE